MQRHVGRGGEETGLAQSNMYRDLPGTVPRKADGGDDTGLVQRHVLNYVPYQVSMTERGEDAGLILYSVAETRSAWCSATYLNIPSAAEKGASLGS